MTKASRKTKNVSKSAARSVHTRKQVGERVQFYNLSDEPDTMAKLDWHGGSRRFVATKVSKAAGRSLASAANPRKIIPISGDDQHVIQCDWDDVSNQYLCKTVPAT